MLQQSSQSEKQVQRTPNVHIAITRKEAALKKRINHEVMQYYIYFHFISNAFNFSDMISIHFSKIYTINI